MVPLITAGMATVIAAVLFVVFYVLPGMRAVRDGELSVKQPEESE